MSVQLNHAMDGLAIPLPADSQPVSTGRTARVQALLREVEQRRENDPRMRKWKLRVLGQKAARGWETNVAAWTGRADVWFEWELDAVRERVAVPLDGMMHQSYANPRGARTRGRTRADRARCGTVTTPGQGAFHSKQ